MRKKLRTILSLGLVVILSSGLFSSVVYGHDHDFQATYDRIVFHDSSDVTIINGEVTLSFSEPMPIEHLIVEKADILEAETLAMLKGMLEESRMGHVNQVFDPAFEVISDFSFEFIGMEGVMLSDFEFTFFPLGELDLDGFIGYVRPLNLYPQIYL